MLKGLVESKTSTKASLHPLLASIAPVVPELPEYHALFDALRRLEECAEALLAVLPTCIPRELGPVPRLVHKQFFFEVRESLGRIGTRLNNSEFALELQEPEVQISAENSFVQIERDVEEPSLCPLFLARSLFQRNLISPEQKKHLKHLALLADPRIERIFDAFRTSKNREALERAVVNLLRAETCLRPSKN